MYLIYWEMCVLLYIGVVVDVPDILGEGRRITVEHLKRWELQHGNIQM